MNTRTPTPNGVTPQTAQPPQMISRRMALQRAQARALKTHPDDTPEMTAAQKKAKIAEPGY